MDLLELIAARKSIRKYKPDSIEPEKLEKVAEAFRLSPSAKNLQGWQLICVENPELKEKIRDASTGRAPMLGQAPAILVAVGFSRRVMTCGHRSATVDLSIAMSYACLEAYTLGLGTCWMASYSEEAIKAALGLPDEASVVAISPIGYADEAPSPKPRKPLAEVFKIIT